MFKLKKPYDSMTINGQGPIRRLYNAWMPSLKPKHLLPKSKFASMAKGFPKEITISITVEETMSFGLTKAELLNSSLWLKITLADTF